MFEFGVGNDRYGIGLALPTPFRLGEDKGRRRHDYPHWLPKPPPRLRCAQADGSPRCALNSARLLIRLGGPPFCRYPPTARRPVPASPPRMRAPHHASVMWRCHTCHERTSSWSRPTSRLCRLEAYLNCPASPCDLQSCSVVSLGQHTRTP